MKKEPGAPCGEWNRTTRRIRWPALGKRERRPSETFKEPNSSEFPQGPRPMAGISGRVGNTSNEEPGKFKGSSQMGGTGGS